MYSGPSVISTTWDNYDSSWGNYHHGTGDKCVSLMFICNPLKVPLMETVMLTPFYCSGVCVGGVWTCAGVKVKFDQKISLRNFYTMDSPTDTLQVVNKYAL